MMLLIQWKILQILQTKGIMYYTGSMMRLNHVPVGIYTKKCTKFQGTEVKIQKLLGGGASQPQDIKVWPPELPYIKILKIQNISQQLNYAYKIVKIIAKNANQETTIRVPNVNSMNFQKIMQKFLIVIVKPDTI